MNDDMYYLNRFTGTDIVVDESDVGVVEKLNWTCASTQVSKNMINPILPSTSQTVSGITVTRNSDETWTISGTATGNVAIALTTANIISLLSGVAYTNQLVVVSGTFAGSIAVTVVNQGGTITYNYMNVQVGTLTKTVTPTENKTIRAYEYYCASGTTINATIRVQLEQNSSATSWTSYNPTPEYPVPIYSSGDSGKLTIWSHKKNGFINNNFTGIVRGLTFTNYNNTLNINGTVDSVYYPSIIFYADGTYKSSPWYGVAGDINRSKGYFNNGNATITLIQNGTRTFSNVFIIGYEDGTVIIHSLAMSDFNTKTYSVTKRINYICIGCSENRTYNMNFQMQIEEGSTATSYEPYTGSQVDMLIPNKSMLDMQNYTYPRYLTKNELLATQNSDGSIQITGTMVTTGYHDIPISPKSTKYLKAGTTYYGKNIVAGCSKVSTGTFYANISIGSGGYTPTEDLYFNSAYWTYYRGSTDVVVNERITPYFGLLPYSEPYEYNIGGSLPNGVADSDTQKKIGKVVLNGSENWGTNGSNATYGQYGFYLTSKANGLSNLWSDKFITKQSALENCISGRATSNFIAITLELSRCAYDLTAFKTWLSTNNVTVYYELATPENITITKPPVSTYEGVNYITTTNNVKPSLTIEAWKR